ncbi:MAG: phosphoribosylglycinamide formyltransferase [Thermoguttaceae bacterium]|nr:phosphoribosylglycinamide formyltransferase [Thermoguttaceae bacterium]
MNIVPYTPKTNRLMRTAVLISGGGRSLKNLLNRIADRRLTGVEISLVISSSLQAGGLRFAAEAAIPAKSIIRKNFADDNAYSESIFAEIRQAEIDFVVFAGFLRRLLIPVDFEGRVINIHPALMPAFCGQGFYGHHVHEAVLAYGAKVSGCTVHFVDNQYDHGPVILQRTVPVFAEDTPDQLADRVFEAELEALPETIQRIADGRVRLKGRITYVE